MENRSDQHRMTSRQVSWPNAKPRDQNKDHQAQSIYLRRENHNEKER